VTHLTAQQLSAQLDGAVIGRALALANRHLADCEDCRHEMDVLAAQDRALAHALLDAPGMMWFDALLVEVETAIDPKRAGRNAVRLATLEAEHENERERLRAEQTEARARALEAQRAEREREDSDARARREQEATEREEKGIREAAALFERARNQSTEPRDDLSEFTTAAMESTAAAEARVRAEATLRAEAEAQARAQAEVETHAQAEAEALERAQAEARTRADAEARAATAAAAFAEAEERAAAAMRARVEAEERAALAARQIAEAEARLREIRAGQAQAAEAAAAPPTVAAAPPVAPKPPVAPPQVAPAPTAASTPSPPRHVEVAPSPAAEIEPPWLEPADALGLPPTLHSRDLPAAPPAPVAPASAAPKVTPPAAQRSAPGAATLQPVPPLSRARERFVAITPPKPQRSAGAAWLAAAAALLTIVCAVLVLLHLAPHRVGNAGSDAASITPAPAPHARAALDSGAAPGVSTLPAPAKPDASSPATGDTQTLETAKPANEPNATSGATRDDSAPRSSASPAARALLSAGRSNARTSTNRAAQVTPADPAASDLDQLPARRVVVEPRNAPGAPVKQAPDPPPGNGLALLCGVVRSSTGQPIAGARVILHELGVGVVTDRQGRFCITAAAGDRLVRVAAPGFVAWGEVVSLGPKTAELEIALKPDSTHAR